MPQHIVIAAHSVTAVENIPENQDDLKNLVEASTARRPAYLPPVRGEGARVWLSGQQCMVNLPEGHWVVVVPSGEVIVLSPGALNSIRA